MLTAEHVSVQVGTKPLLSDISFTLQEGNWLMITGPNGAGKTTLIRALAQNISYEGHISFDGKNLAHVHPKQRARALGVLMQRNHVEYSFSVEEVVRLGRYAYSQGLFAKKNEEDDFFVEDALRKTGLLALRNRSALTLSGGELQRCFLAQIFAQNPQILVLDEPANHLDLIYQKQMFDVIKHWLQNKNRAVLSVVHDLSLAKCYGSHAMLLNDGKILACDSIEKTLTNQHLNDVYRMDVAAWMQQMLTVWSA